MSRSVLANLGFEYELAGRPLSAVVRAYEARFASILRVVPGWRDAAPWVAGAQAEVLSWGYSQRAREVAGPQARRWPSLESTRRVNSKVFSLEVEQALGCALPGARLVWSIEGAERAAAEFGWGWVAKHPFGVAGRERVAGQGWGGALRERLEALFATTDVLILEPLVQVGAEYSVHFEIPADAGAPQFIGATRLLTDARGAFRGNDTRALVPPEIEQAGHAAAALVAAAGYHGPLGIDAFVGILGGQAIIRPVVELNARWTFGRLALELARTLGRPLAWHHATRQRPAALVPAEVSSSAGAYLLPGWCDPEGISGTWIELFDDAGKIDGRAPVC